MYSSNPQGKGEREKKLLLLHPFFICTDVRGSASAGGLSKLQICKFFPPPPPPSPRRSQSYRVSSWQLPPAHNTTTTQTDRRVTSHLGPESERGGSSSKKKKKKASRRHHCPLLCSLPSEPQLEKQIPNPISKGPRSPERSCQG